MVTLTPGPKVENEDYVIIPPDGGWGWIVVLAAFYCQMVLDGIMLTFGMILDEIADFYQTPHSSAAWIGSVMYGMHYIAGPMCAALSFYFGERTVCAFGSILTAAGLAVVYFEPPLCVLVVSAGFFGGIGLCFINMNSIVVTTLYFSRRRILVMGIVVCGTGAGTMLFTYFAYVIKAYWDWKAVCFIQAAFALSMGLVSLAFRPLTPTIVQTVTSVTSAEITTEEVQENNLPLDNVDNSIECSTNVFYIRDPDILDHDSSEDGEFEKETGQALEEIAVNIVHPTIPRLSRRRKIWVYLCCRRSKAVLLMNPVYRQRILHDDVEHGVRKMSVEDLRAPRHSTIQSCFHHFFNTFKNYHLLKSFPFLMYCLSGAFSASALLIVLYYEKKLIKINGGDEKDAMRYLIYLGGVSMFWRLFLGVISMMPKINYQVLHAIGLVLGGAATAAISLSPSFNYIYLCGALYGFAIACFAVFLPIELFELVGTKRISYATGVSMLFMGGFSATGAPLAGLAMEASKTYSVTFYIAGGMLVLSGFLLILVKYAKKVE